jgi:hypothetical protein
MNDYSQLNNEQIESRLAHVAPNECFEELGHSEPQEPATPEPEPAFSNAALWDLHREIHSEIDEQISACAKINNQIDEKILRRY